MCVDPRAESTLIPSACQMEGKGGMSEAASIDTFYLLYCGSLVFFMQAGFGLLEAGTVRSKNLKNILLKNTLDACISAVVWWAWGFGMAVR